MPCFSKVKNTIMVDGDRIQRALEALGYGVQWDRGRNRFLQLNQNGDAIARWEKQGDGTWAVASGDAGRMTDICRKYAELGIRDWAKKRGFGIASFRENRMTLVNRRG